MATLTLPMLWINLMADGTGVSAYSSDRSLSYASEGEVRTYAGGRQRSIAAEGTRSQWSFRLVPVTAATVATLNGWRNLAVQVRDHRGQALIGVYRSVEIGELPSGLYSIGLTVQGITEGT